MKDDSPIRFAPSTTGVAHPGTLISALLCWLDARSRGARFVLRLENLDPDRGKPEFEQAMLDDLAWFGLDWDAVVLQHQRTGDHEAALDALAAQGLLYPCACSRARIKSMGKNAPDGGFAYDNCCRNRSLPSGGWRETTEPLRVRLPDDTVDFLDEGGWPIRQCPVREMGDPVVRRRDGAMAYHLAVVVDDARDGFQRLIRGRDLAPSAPVQILLQRLLGLPTPFYRHHFLFLELHGGKLAKFHGAVGTPQLKQKYRAEELCGRLAFWCGLTDQPEPVRPQHLVASFQWSRVRRDDGPLGWDGQQLSMPDHNLSLTNRRPPPMKN